VQELIQARYVGNQRMAPLKDAVEHR
jgi:hypothetical protein